MTEFSSFMGQGEQPVSGWAGHAMGSEPAWRAIVEDLPIAVVIFGAAEFRIDFANRAYLAMVGRENVVGLTLDQVNPGVSPHSIYGYLSDVLRDRQPRERREHALLIPAPKGATHRYFTNRFQPVFDDAGEVHQILVTVLDVTSEVRARKLVAESAERLRVILDEMPVGANVRDARTGEVVINNKASTEILGIELGWRGDPASIESLNARFPDGRRLRPDDHAFRRAMVSREPVRNQIVILNRAGTDAEIVVRSSAAIVEGPDAVALVVSVIEDITEEYRLLAEHEQTAHFAEIFVGILAHDLRTPLSAIMIGAALLDGRLSDTPQHALVIGRIARSARRMGDMVSQLLDLTRSRLAGGIPVERSPVDLVAVLTGVLDEIAVANPGVTLSRAVPEQVVGEWDGARWGQVVSNLVGNAVQHGDRAHPIVVALEDRGATAILTVHNRGVIPPDVLPELFDAFPHRSRPTRAKTTGLGLGLFITREIVTAHGGSIRATSTEADGTSFTVTLPRVAVANRGPHGG